MSGRERAARAARRRDGFTLVELAIAVMIIGILASVAAPAIQYAILKADATRLVGDAHTVSLATYEYLAANGRFPSTGALGTIPPELAGVLPDNFPFTYKDVQYRWYSFSFPDTNNFWQTRTLGILLFDYSQRLEMGDPMYSYYGPDAFWSSNIFYFLYRG